MPINDRLFPGSLTVPRDPFVAALVCPRPWQVQADSQDLLFPIGGARRTAPPAAEFYRKLGVGERFDFEEFVARHDFHGEEAWRFIDQALGAGQ